MSNLDDLKDELEFEIRRLADGTEQEMRDAIEFGRIQLDAGATFREALTAAKMRLKEAA